MTARSCPDDLLVVARCRALSDLERKALSAHLARCPLCRADEIAAGLLRERFAGDGAVSREDRALVERVAERASASVAKGVRHGAWGWRRAAVAAVVFLGLGGVASAWIGRSWVAPRPADRAPAASGSFVRPRVDREASRLVRPSPPAEPAAVEPARPLPPARRHLAARPVRDVDVPEAPDETAASLFADANRARHDGDLRRAVALYGALRAAFPDAPEARVSSVSMGDLMMRLDEPARALRAFDAYLSEVRTGPLREEALFGRVRCLRALKDPAAEGETWSRLVREFPGSAYAPVARQRLDELRRGR